MVTFRAVQNSMSLGQLPKRLVIGCVDSDALNGAITKSPFDFKHYKITCVALTSDGIFTTGLFQSFDVTHSYGRT
jgi:hypothetical protein